VSTTKIDNLRVGPAVATAVVLASFGTGFSAPQLSRAADFCFLTEGRTVFHSLGATPATSKSDTPVGAWEPKTPLGRKLAQLREAAIRDGMQLQSIEAINAEIEAGRRTVA
jgi:hypothetical protein